MRGLYAIIDVETLDRRGLDPLRFAESVLEAGPAALQVRDKVGGARRALARLRSLAPLSARRGVPLFANDRPDLALLSGCDGVHVGQDDLPVALVRSLAAGRERKLRVGLSTHDEAQVKRALEEAPDYLALGPIFATSTKENASPVVGLDALARLAALVRAARPGLPIVAIGGIGMENAARVGEHADAAAVIAALLPEGNGADAWSRVTDRAAALHAAICGVRRAE
jgi:thiamine-phosphate pyrophosphorylase